MTQTDQQRIDELEMKAAFQEQLISELNDALIKQADRIDALELGLQRLMDYVNTLQDPEPDPDETPPHY